MNLNSAPLEESKFSKPDRDNEGSADDGFPRDSRHKGIVIGFWALALILGAIQTWFTRHNMIADGISYLEIASNYFNGHWNEALNPYWSPLYSWAIAIAMFCLHPGSYWQLATLHLVNYAGFLLGLAALEWLLRELILYRSIWEFRAQRPSVFTRCQPLSRQTIYVIAYAAHIFAGLILIGIGFCSPDLLAMCLSYCLAALTIRMLRSALAKWEFAVAGLLFGLSFLARTAFLPLSPIYLIVFVWILRRRKRSLGPPVGALLGTFVLVAGPFILALSWKEHRLTFGDSGRLNYAWEVDGAARWMHWQGEPYDIGKPLHPTTKVSSNPAAYVFDSNQPGTYAPWYNPSYWYAGVRPHVKIVPQLKVFFFNITYAVRLLVSFPLTFPVMLLLFLEGWSAVRFGMFRLFQLWPILLPPAVGVLTYCLVFLDKRYVAGFLVLLWLSLAYSVALWDSRLRRAANLGLQLLHAVVLAALIIIHFRIPAKLVIQDIAAGRERERNLHYVLADRFSEIGLHPGDKIAYLGVTFNADWTRLDNVKIVGEVPVIYVRHWKAFSSNVSHDDLSQLAEFWNADSRTRDKIFEAFKRAGAKMIVTDGTFSEKADSLGFHAVLSPSESRLPFSEGQGLSQIRTRYLWLR